MAYSSYTGGTVGLHSEVDSLPGAVANSAQVSNFSRNTSLHPIIIAKIVAKIHSYHILQSRRTHANSYSTIVQKKEICNYL